MELAIEHVSFDNVYKEMVSRKPMSDQRPTDGASSSKYVKPDFEPERWRESRKLALEKSESILSQRLGNNMTGRFHSKVCLSCGRVFKSRSSRRVHQMVMSHDQRMVSNSDGPIQKTASLLLLLVDDNFYYRSMRHDFFKLARNYQVGYAQLFIDSSVDDAIFCNDRRNKILQERVRMGDDPERSRKDLSVAVDNNTITKMADMFEKPEPRKIFWEQNTFKLTSFAKNDTISMDLANAQLASRWFSSLGISWSCLFQCATTGIPRPLEDIDAVDERKRRSKIANLKSFMHQADMNIRKAISGAMQNSSNLDKAARQTHGKFLNSVRKDLLSDLKRPDSQVREFVESYTPTSLPPALRSCDDDDMRGHLAAILHLFHQRSRANLQATT